MGGQTALNLATELEDSGILAELGIELIGAGVETPMTARDHWLHDLHPTPIEPSSRACRRSCTSTARRGVDEPLHEPAGRAAPGVHPEEWSGDPELWLNRLHPDDRDRAIDTHRLSNATAERYHDEVPDAHEGRAHVWIHDEAAPVLGE